MKRNQRNPFLFLFVMLCLMLSSCQNVSLGGIDDDNDDQIGTGGKKVALRVSVSRLEQIPFAQTGYSVRATDVSKVCTRLCFDIYKPDGTRVKYVNQKQGDDDYGKATLNVEPGTYRLVVLAHSSDKSIATTNIEKIPFGTDISDVFYYSEEINVTENTSVDVSLKRAVARLEIVSLDKVPQASNPEIQILCSGGGGSAFNALKGVGVQTTKQSNQVISIPTDSIGKTFRFGIYIFPLAETDTIDVTVKFVTRDGVQKTKNLGKVGIKRNMITRYSGYLFSDDPGKEVGATINFFSDDEWETEEHTF